MLLKLHNQSSTKKLLQQHFDVCTPSSFIKTSSLLNASLTAESSFIHSQAQDECDVMIEAKCGMHFYDS